MDIKSQAIVAQAYATARPAPRPEPTPGPQGSFAQIAGQAHDTMTSGEAAAKAAMTSGADPQALVQALAQTELAVEAAVTVRNKVVEAYQEILRMPV